MNRIPVQELICLDGQTAVVTGGAFGIGSAISARLAEAGATVCVADIARSEAERCCAEIRQRGGAAFFSPLDVTEPLGSDNVASEVISQTGRLDIWVNPSLVAYAVSKAGVVSLTQNLAAALGPFGIRVVAVSPGVVLTGSMQTHLDRLAHAGSQAADRAGTLPLRRLADPDDVARVVLFLCSELAAYVTGQNLVVDGGDSVGGGTADASLEALLRDAP